MNVKLYVSNLPKSMTRWEITTLFNQAGGVILADLIMKQEQLWFLAGEEREEGFKEFLDDKTYKPGLGIYKRNSKE